MDNVQTLGVLAIRKCNISYPTSNTNQYVSFNEAYLNLSDYGVKNSIINCTDMDQDRLLPTPVNSTQTCITDPSIKSRYQCTGEPYQNSFFQVDSTNNGGTNVAFKRRSVLFNVYSFD